MTSGRKSAPRRPPIAVVSSNASPKRHGRRRGLYDTRGWAGVGTPTTSSYLSMRLERRELVPPSLGLPSRVRRGCAGDHTRPILSLDNHGRDKVSRVVASLNGESIDVSPWQPIGSAEVAYLDSVPIGHNARMPKTNGDEPQEGACGCQPDQVKGDVPDGCRHHQDDERK
jgi:hypothetical protein